MADIGPFLGRWRFLSNFYIEPDGTCVEIEYQQSKCANPDDMSLFDGLTPAKAKRLGRHLNLRSDWDSVKLDVMYWLVMQKFRDHPELARKLRDTGISRLVEHNTWNDTYWGVCAGIGHNHLGRILMRVRQTLTDVDSTL